MTSDYATLDGCPNCGSREFRPIAPLSPEVEAYQCETCNQRWSE